MKRGKKWPLNGLLHLNRDFAAAAAAAEGIPDHHLRFEQRHRSYSMDDGGVGAAATRMDTKKERGKRANPPFLCMVTR